MPRLGVDPGEMAQPTVGAIVPPEPPKRPCCETCNDDGCVGHCKF
ncbi:MAG: hypothetical protein NTW28_09720 [Candidatus Solibacter sp.]|nr:hypothetical protein [Candidatus Solibacter sp.]